MKSVNVVSRARVGRACVVAAIAAAALAVPSARAASVAPASPSGLISFDFSRALVAGAGCSTNDGKALAGSTPATLDAAHVVAPFTLSGGGADADRASCTIRVPIKIAAGHYLAGVSLHAVYDALKSDDPSLNVAFAVSAFAQSGAHATVDLPPGASESSYGKSADDAEAFAAPQWCGPATNGLLTINVAFSAAGVGAGDIAAAELTSLRLREGSELFVQPCP